MQGKTRLKCSLLSKWWRDGFRTSTGFAKVCAPLLSKIMRELSCILRCTLRFAYEAASWNCDFFPSVTTASMRDEVDFMMMMMHIRERSRLNAIPTRRRSVP